MTTLENFYFGNINPSDYRQSAEVRKKLSAMAALMEELSSLPEEDQQKEKIAQIAGKQTELIALSERDAYIEGFKLGVKMATEIYTDK
jgi:hypothetical protein